MAHLIDKDAVVAEIESYKSAAEWMLKGKTDLEHWSSQKGVCDKLLYFITSLEVKGVDLEKELSYEEYKSFFDKHPDFSNDWGFDEAFIFAKYFYSLGLKAQKG